MKKTKTPKVKKLSPRELPQLLTEQVAKLENDVKATVEAKTAAVKYEQEQRKREVQAVHEANASSIQYEQNRVRDYDRALNQERQTTSTLTRERDVLKLEVVSITGGGASNDAPASDLASYLQRNGYSKG